MSFGSWIVTGYGDPLPFFMNKWKAGGVVYFASSELCGQRTADAARISR